MEKLFEKYTSVYYNGMLCCDITKRVKLSDTAKKSTSLYYPIELKAGLRADSLADAYYEDPELDWLIYITNEVVDPYYHWYLDEAEFETYIKEKYGSIEAAVKKIKYYRNNWSNDDREISPTYYDNHLAFEQRQYFSPEYGNNGKILSYKRKKEDWITNTNKIVQFDIQLTDDLFQPDEIVDIKDGATIVGEGTVVTCNTSALIIQHVSGDISANDTVTKTIQGEVSNVIANTNSVTILQENITNADAVFWTSVSWFDWEVEENEKKKNIIVMNSAYTLDVAEQLRAKMQE